MNAREIHVQTSLVGHDQTGELGIHFIVSTRLNSPPLANFILSKDEAARMAKTINKLVRSKASAPQIESAQKAKGDA